MIFREYSKRITGLVIIVSMTLSSFAFLSAPKDAKAQTAVVDAGNIVQSTMTAIQTGISSVSGVGSQALQYSNTYKENILDPIAYAIAKTLLRSLTTSVVEWINSGFEGSPSFLSDTSGFFQNIIGEQIGEFIAGNSDLSFLCSPFSIDIRIALAFKYRPFKKRISCTLNDIIANSQNAIAGASINGFTAGDFKQGGWPAFASLSTEPQNNVYGAYLEAEAELDMRLGNLVNRKKSELNQGAGFLSYEKCYDETTSESIAEERSGYEARNSGRFVSSTTPDGRTVNKYCETLTPGSVISGGLQKSIGAPVDELNLADEFNEIVNALFAQLLKSVITGGLKTVSGNGRSDQNSLLNRINASGEGKIVERIIKQMKKDIDIFLKNEEKYRAGKQKEYQLLLDRIEAYEDAAVCFENKASSTIASSEDTRRLLAFASSTRALITSYINPIREVLEGNVLAAEEAMEILKAFKVEVATATSSAALNMLSESYNDLVTGGSLHDANDLGTINSDYAKTRKALNDINPSAADRKETCRTYIFKP